MVIRASDFELKEFICNVDEIIKAKGLEPNGKAQQYIDSEVLRLSEPLIPRDTGKLIESGIINTEIGSGQVKYRTPYARRWYYMPANFSEAPERGNYWFERMKQKHINSIMDGVKRLTNGT